MTTVEFAFNEPIRTFHFKVVCNETGCGFTTTISANDIDETNAKSNAIYAIYLTHTSKVHPGKSRNLSANSI